MADSPVPLSQSKALLQLHLRWRRQDRAVQSAKTSIKVLSVLLQREIKESSAIDRQRRQSLLSICVENMSSTSPATKYQLAKIRGEGESLAESLIESTSKFKNDLNCCNARRASYPVYPSSSNSRVDVNADMAFNYYNYFIIIINYYNYFIIIINYYNYFIIVNSSFILLLVVFDGMKMLIK